MTVSRPAAGPRTEHCRCSDPRPKMDIGKPWVCPGCGLHRRYYDKISVGRGGIVSRCGECRWEARKRHEKESSVALTLCRAVTVDTSLAGEVRQHETYYLCDACTDAEIARAKEADVLDGREHDIAVPKSPNTHIGEPS